jgi:5-hydroxyisourate hydrolase-like protein (transthyretin family)
MHRRDGRFKKSKKVKSMEVYKAQQEPVITEPEVPVQPAEPAPPTTTGLLSVSVNTALGALPVQDALVTVYIFDENEEEQNLYIRTTDENGRVEDMILGVFYDPTNPLVNEDFYFTTYNLRVQAINYYTENIFDFRIFPDVKSTLRVSLVPVMLTEDPQSPPERRIIIPPSPVDEINR